MWTLQIIVASGHNIHEVIEVIPCLWSLQFVVARGHNILEDMERLFTVRKCHRSLCLEVTRLLKSQRGNF